MPIPDRVFFSLFWTGVSGGFGGTLFVALAMVKALGDTSDDIPGIFVLPLLVPMIGIASVLVMILIGIPLAMTLKRFRQFNHLSALIAGACIGGVAGLCLSGGQTGNGGIDIIVTLAATGILVTTTAYGVWKRTDPARRGVSAPPHP